LTSPLRRTLQTTLLGFPKLKERAVPLEIYPDLQETQAHPCDIGSPRSTLQDWFREDSWLDFSNCIDGWTEKKGKYAPTEEALDARALNIRRQLKRRKERVVTVVCHAGFLRHIICAPHSHMWGNVEARVYRFEKSSDGNSETSLPSENDQALLLRVDRAEELRILGGSGANLAKTN